MDSINWGLVSAIADLVAATGVIVSLVYLAIQIHHNNRFARQASYNSDARTLQDLGTLLASDAELSRIFAIGIRTPVELSANESRRFTSLATQCLFAYEGLLSSYEQRLITEDQWVNCVDNFMDFLSSPLLLEMASARRSPLSKRLYDQIVQRMK